MGFEPLPDHVKAFVLYHFHSVPTGFCDEVKALKFAEIIWNLKPKWSVEIGVYGGKSFIPIAATIAQLDKNQGLHRAVGIDVWEANAAADHYQNTPHYEFWKNQMLLDMVRVEAFQCLNKLNTLSAQYYVGKSEDASKCFQDNEIGFCHIDGNHSEHYVNKDLDCWWPKLQIGGVIILDDVGWIPDSAVKRVSEKSEFLEIIGSTHFYKKLVN